MPTCPRAHTRPHAHTPICPYAHEIRTCARAPTQDWWHIKYHAHLRNATFCGAFPGDGWSGGISSAVFAGCVPVIIMDGIDMPFENVLRYEAFSVRAQSRDFLLTGSDRHYMPTPQPCTRACSVHAPPYAHAQVRIAEADVDRLPAILRAIPPSQIAKLQAGLRDVRSRFGYGSLARNEMTLSLSPEPRASGYLSALAAHNDEHEDALQTMVRVLLYRAETRRQK